MSNQQPSFSRLFNAPTDIPALLVIVLGLAIALFLGDLPVRLIGVCVAVLGTIGVVVLYNQRIKDLSALQEYSAQRPAVKTVSEVADFKTTMTQELGSKRLVFDDFAESFGTVDDDIPSSQPSSTQRSAQRSEQTPSKTSPQPIPKTAPKDVPKPPVSITTALPKTLVFDDFDDTAGFDDVNELTLKTAPEKFTPSEPPPVIPTLPSAVQQTLSDVAATNASAHISGTHLAGTKVLVFDDSDESSALQNDFMPTIAIGQTTLPSELQPKPAPAPVTPPPPPVSVGEILPGTFNAPKLDETLLGAEFDDDDGTEFRIVGKAAPNLTPAPTTLVSSEPQAKKKDDEITPAIPTQEQAQALDAEPQSASADVALEFAQEVVAQEVVAQNTQEITANPLPDTPSESLDNARSEPQELTSDEDIQGKVTRAAKAALKREIYEAPKQTSASGAKQPNKASTELSEEAVSHRRKKLTVQMEDIVEETPEAAKNEPRREFEYLLQRILLAIRSAMSARTTAFWWYAADRKQLTLEAKISDVSEAMRKTIDLTEVGDNVFSHITETGAPEILMEISRDAELQLVPYYASPSQTRSFVGVPVYFDKAIVGVLTADSTDDDAYDNATVSFLGHFTKLIGGLIQSYTEKYDLLQSARTLDAIDTFRQLTLKPDRTSEDVCTALIRSLMRLVPYTTMGTCIYSEDRSAWYVSNLHTKDATAREILGGEVYLDNSLVGKSVTNGRTYRFANPAANFVRVTQREPKPQMLAFTAVPLVSVSRCYGALFIEEKGETRLTKQDVEIIETVAEYAGTALEQMQLQDYVQTHALLQEASENTMVGAAVLKQRMNEEIARAEDVELAMTLALISLDKYAAFSNNLALWDELNHALVQVLRQNLRPYDIIARYHGTTLAVCLIEKDTQAAQMWSERVRRDIAATSLSVGGKQYSVTVSIGVAEYRKQKSLDELLEHAEKALDAALKKTNSVSIFS
ncbi:MAG: GAF domain-containing protein [Candidatus Kapabacteria bacterium]|jgi:diguanylate cyclase (GGDEF)-like protein|nr:GAF domain-containing protein [Candidatus Kapabacteria bacterium]